MVLSAAPYNYDRFLHDPNNKDGKRPPHPVTMMIKRVLRRLIDLLELPANPLDNLVHLCGGMEVVAEMTGRKFVMEVQPDGTFQKVRRCAPGDGPQSQLNLREKERFMAGEKRIAIISAAASTGISLQVCCPCCVLLCFGRLFDDKRIAIISAAAAAGISLQVCCATVVSLLASREQRTKCFAACFLQAENSETSVSLLVPLLASPLVSPLVSPLASPLVSPLALPLVSPLVSPLASPLVSLRIPLRPENRSPRAGGPQVQEHVAAHPPHARAPLVRRPRHPAVWPLAPLQPGPVSYTHLTLPTTPYV